MPLDGKNFPKSSETRDGPVVKCLRDARRLVAKGWCQHLGEDAYGNHCVMGAVGEVAGDTDTHVKAYRALANAIPLTRMGFYQGVAEYNDAPGRKKAEILALFDKAIENEITKEG